MGDQTLLIYRSKRDRSPFVFDAVVNPTVTLGVDVSRFPLETGAQLVEHSQLRPQGYSFQGVLVNEPADDGAAQRRSDATIAPDNGATSGAGFRDPLVSARILGPQVNETRASGLQSELTELARKREPVYVAAEGVRFTTFLISGLTSRQVGRGAIEISGTLTQALFAGLEEVELKPIPAATRRRKSSKVDDVGVKGTTETKAADKTKVKSLLLKAVEAAGLGG